ncbi:peptidoglycan-binding domain-containing protein [Clostridium akagii]|uniref:peptidoglycan-binding domain-containing protein n=1 Tax=Clostridium akagii TaxID=91623 RepID=UPI00056B3FBA|nr:peptidoglycan-binding domain-containing protein [Clostridium akagii]
MKNLKIKALTLGILATVVISSTPAFAATNASTSSSTASVITTTPAIPGTVKTASNPYATAITIRFNDTVCEIQGSNGFFYGLQIYISDDNVGNGCVNRAYNVEALQLALNHYGYNLVVDSLFGTNTRNALINFQGRAGYGLTQDGICGPNTWLALGNHF